MKNVYRLVFALLIVASTISCSTKSTTNQSDSTTMPQENLQVALNLLEAFKQYDMPKARSLMHDSLNFRTPTHEFHSADSFIEFYKEHVPPGVFDYELTDSLYQDHKVVLKYIFLTPDGKRTPEIDWYEVRDGKVMKVEAYF